MDSNINYEEVNISKEKNSNNSYFNGVYRILRSCIK